MRKHLLPENGTFYKANLHCHSTVSDGRWTPEEIKKKYAEKGYSIVAYKDYHIFYPHNELCDESFVALNGVEFGVNNIVDGVPANKFRKKNRMFRHAGMLNMRPCQISIGLWRFQMSHVRLSG